MRRFRDLSITRKLIAISLLISGIAVGLACGGFALMEQSVGRNAMKRDFAILADIFDENVASGLAFNDAKAIELTLGTLSANPHIVGACVYDLNGTVVGRYVRPADRAGFVAPRMQPPGQRFTPDRLETFKDVVLAGERVGVVYIRADLIELKVSARRYAVAIAVLLLGCLAVSLVLAARLQKFISEPILELEAMAARVAEDNDYARRANKRGEDEIGRLIDGFNHMLAQIQARDIELQRTHAGLERRVEERTRELAWKTALLEAQMDCSPDGILVVNTQGRRMLQNQLFCDLWRIPREIAEDPDTERQVAFVRQQPKDVEAATRRILHLYAHPDETARDEIELKDDRFLDRYTSPVRGKDGAVYGRIWTVRDITARKHAEAELARAHRQLVDASRQAGMAEVATSVLHNVGNVLNSVNVSATLVTDHIRQSRASMVGRLADLLQAHATDLPAFLADDPRGRQIPAYLRTLAGHLATEQAATLAELEALRKNVEHIKDIVVMQQSYAKVSGVAEHVAIVELVEDALRMNAGALLRHEVTVTREFQSNPVVAIEKHKVLQILVNLIRNAKYACDESGRTDKHITVRIGSADGCLSISVTDNGVGIPAENLTRIFGHGFTTRKEGHGFGLHSGALAARELGGTLRVHSDGPGCGATFTLELPAGR